MFIFNERSSWIYQNINVLSLETFKNDWLSSLSLLSSKLDHKTLDAFFLHPELAKYTFTAVCLLAVYAEYYI